MRALVTILLATAVIAAAQAPQKDPLTKYRQLWEASLVTEKPTIEPDEEEEAPTELDDYVLGGWTQTSQGYLVSLINTKNPKERRTIAPGMPNKGGYQVLEVKRDPMNYKSSEVLVKVGSAQKWIGYEEKFLTLQQPPAAQRNQAAQQAAQRAALQKNQQNQQRPQNQNRNQNRNQNQNQQRPPIPNSNSGNNGGANANSQQTQSTQRQPRVRRVPVPPKK